MKAFVNGKIWQWRGPADDYTHAFAEWMLVSDAGEVLRVGSGDLPAEAVDADVAREDLSGRLVLPGLHDSHIHAYGLGESAEYLDLFGCESFEDLAQRLAAYDARYPDKAWIVGFGWAQDKLSALARYPSRHDIDAVVRDRPVILHRGCWHIAVVNTKALEIAGVDITQTHHEIQGSGAIDVDVNGVTGILRESVGEHPIVELHCARADWECRLSRS
jgi:predicted amidohydrolase YtcJ